MRRLLLFLMVAVTTSPAVAQRLEYDGKIIATGPVVEVQLGDYLDVPRGTVVHSFIPKEVDRREVGILSGVFRVLRTDGSLLHIVPAASAGDPQNVQVGQPVQIAFTGPPGSVAISSEPSAASLVWRGEVLGTTPLLDLRLAPGSYTCSLVAPGYRTYTLTIDVLAGQVVDLVYKLKPFPAARSYYEEAWRLYFAHAFDDAQATLDSTDMFVDDGSLTEEIRQNLPVLRDLVHESQGLVARNAEVPEETIQRVFLAYRLYRRNVNGGDPKAVEEGVNRLYALLPSDPLVRRLYTEHRLLTEPAQDRR